MQQEVKAMNVSNTTMCLDITPKVRHIDQNHSAIYSGIEGKY